MSSGQRIAGIDLGKTRCRFAVDTAAGRIAADAGGAPGLAAAGGVDAALDAIVPLVAPLRADFDALGVGAAGAWAAPEAARLLARRLAQRLEAPVAVASDVVTAHAGALQGGPGVLLIAGTGAAALGVDEGGVRLVDGWGPELGDLGSGSWLGREGLRAVLRAGDRLGPATALTDAAATHIDGYTDLHSWLAQPGPTARLLATFAPAVLNAAQAGDVVAVRIATEAVRLLTASALAASDDVDVTVHGGLTDHLWFRAELEAVLVAEGRTIVPADADAIAGARLLASRTDLPHERYLHRAG